MRTFEPAIIAQIETAVGVANAGAIAALPEVDALFLGPYDLSASLGAPGDFDTPAFKEAIETVRAACRKHGKAEGIHQIEPDPAKLEARVKEGFRLLAYGTDLIAIRHAFRGLSKFTDRRAVSAGT